MRDFRTLDVWKKSHALTLEIYRITATFPAGEDYGLTSQMRRAAASIPSNIAEGCGKETDADLKRYLYIASGSASELDYQLILARDLLYIGPDAYQTSFEALSEVRRMLTGFVKRLRGSS